MRSELMKPSRNRILVALLGFALASGAVAAESAAKADATDGKPSARVSKPGASALYEKAQMEYSSGDIRAAYLDVKNALLEDPFLLPAHLLLGNLYIQLGFGGKAEKELLVAQSLGADQSLTRIPMARAYLLQGKADQLIGELFARGSSPEEDAELLALRGQAHLQLRQIVDAQRAFAQAWERNPNSVAAILGRVQVLLQQGKLSEAQFYARRATEVAPSSPRVWYAKGTLLRVLGDTQSALRDFERATTILPAHMPAQIARVSALLDLGRVDEAVRVAEELRKLYPRDPRSLYVLAVAQGRRQDMASANESLKAAELLISQMPRELIDGHPPTLLLAGMVSYSLKQWAQATDYLTDYIEKFPDSVGPRTLLGQIYLDRHSDGDALKVLEPAQSIAPGDGRVLALLAETYMRLGQHMRASELLQLLSDSSGDNEVLRVQRAVNQFGMGRKEQAIEDLGAVVGARPGTQPFGATLVVMELNDRQIARAVSEARALVESDPNNLTYLNLYGVALLAAGDLDAARWAFDLILTVDDRFVPAELNLAELALRVRNPTAARERLLRALHLQGDNLSAMLMLARAAEAEGKDDEARNWAERAAVADPGAVPIAVYLTNLLLKMQRSDDAVRVAESTEARAAESDNLALLAALSRAYIANGQQSTAQAVLARASNLAADAAPSLLEIATLQRQAGDFDGARWSLEKAVQGQPKYLPTRIKLGELYVESGKLVQASDLARALARDFPKKPYGEHLLGLIAQKRGQQAEALEHFNRALQLEESPVLAARAYETLRVVQGAGPALDFLVGWLAKHPDDAIAGRALAEGLFRAGRSADALPLYRKILKETPDDPMFLNNLAMVYARERPTEAVELARRAYAKAPESPEIADTLGWVLVLQGKNDEGLKLLREARSKSADDPGISYHIAYALQGLGREDEARRELAGALKSDRPFPERVEAQRLGERLEKASSGRPQDRASVLDPGTD